MRLSRNLINWNKNKTQLYHMPHILYSLQPSLSQLFANYLCRSYFKFKPEQWPYSNANPLRCHWSIFQSTNHTLRKIKYLIMYNQTHSLPSKYSIIFAHFASVDSHSNWILEVVMAGTGWSLGFQIFYKAVAWPITWSPAFFFSFRKRANAEK